MLTSLRYLFSLSFPLSLLAAPILLLALLACALLEVAGLEVHELPLHPLDLSLPRLLVILGLQVLHEATSSTVILVASAHHQFLHLVE